MILVGIVSRLLEKLSVLCDAVLYGGTPIGFLLARTEHKELSVQEDLLPYDEFWAPFEPCLVSSGYVLCVSRDYRIDGPLLSPPL